MAWITPDWISAIGTFFAVVVALLISYWDRRQGRASLRISVRPAPPDWSSTAVQSEPEEGGMECFFVVRLTVANRGPAAARMVEAVVHELERLEGGAWVRRGGFLPGSLRWTHGVEPHLALLMPKTEKHVDLGEIRRNGVTGNNAGLTFTIVPQPTLVYNSAGPGEYRFRVTVAAENAHPTTARFELRLTGEWHAEDEVMAQKGLSMRQLR
jgi:hypothetical protein